ncbi:MAG: flap endonuclease-1 [Thermoprotei archaeon]|nr:MAG: flap endonuclease-1 [Thermoprotei archaeon]RLF03516.1 MAG: flap endonuclease-1 [Thermoprotei archaeon]
MGVPLTPIIPRKVLTLEHFRGKWFAVDANNVLYQFLALIRTPDGKPLTSPTGEITSHLVGLAFRATKLICDYEMRLVFVFDGKPHGLKARELMKRKEVREKAYKEWVEALKRGDYDAAFSKAVVTGVLTRKMVEDAKKLLDLLGIPWIQAPSDAEAQAAYMVSRGGVWAVNSRDYDSLLYGTPRLVRYLTISGTEFLPSKGIVRRLQPELIELNNVLSTLNITREQLIDVAILVGTDFNEGVKGIGPKTALRLIRIYKRIEKLPASIRDKVAPYYQEVREIFLNPPVTTEYTLDYKRVDEEGLIRFLCDEKGFSPKRVETLISRMKRVHIKGAIYSMDEWI